MGLDMYLEGRKFILGNREKAEVTEDGFRLKEKILEIGYWRKEPNLHGYIVENFADGRDECQDIHLSIENLEQIRQAVKGRVLPVTSGFFFGVSCDPNSDDLQEREWAAEFEKYTDETLAAAIQWLKDGEADRSIWRSVYYRASW